MTVDRKIGRPPVYRFDLIEMDDSRSWEGSTVDLEKIRSAALAYARRSGRMFVTQKESSSLRITRVG